MMETAPVTPIVSLLGCAVPAPAQETAFPAQLAGLIPGLPVAPPPVALENAVPAPATAPELASLLTASTRFTPAVIDRLRAPAARVPLPADRASAAAVDTLTPIPGPAGTGVFASQAEAATSEKSPAAEDGPGGLRAVAEPGAAPLLPVQAPPVPPASIAVSAPLHGLASAAASGSPEPAETRVAAAMATRDRQPHTAASQMLPPVISQYPRRGEPTAAIATIAAQGQAPEAPADTAATVLPEEAPTVIADFGQRLATRLRKAAADAAPAPAVLTTAATLLASHAVARRTPEAVPAPGIASEGASPGSGGAAQPLFILPASTPGSPVAAADALAGAAPAADFGQLAIDRQLDLSSANAWLDDLARDIAAAAMKGEKLSFALSPEHLGRMDVQLSAGENGVSVGIRTETSEARAIIAQAQPRLAEELRNNGVRLADAQVDTGAGHDRDGGRQYHAQEQRLVEAAPWAAPEPADEPEAAPSGRFA